MNNPQTFFEQIKKAQLLNKQKTASAVTITTTTAKPKKTAKLTDEQYCELITNRALVRIKQLSSS